MGVLWSTNNSALAGGGGGFVGATEFTQIANNVQLGNQYAQQVQQFTTQLQQYQAQLRNLALNPASLLPGDIPNLIAGMGSIMTAGNAIGNSMAQIDHNFSNIYKSPQATNYADQFNGWTGTTQDTLGAAMKVAGAHRDAHATDTQNLTALYNKAQQSQGTVSAIQTLSEINTSQIQHLMNLEDLISSQNLASSAWMAQQTAKDQAAQDQLNLHPGSVRQPSLSSFTPSGQ